MEKCESKMANGNLFKFFSTVKFCSFRQKFVLALHVNSKHIKYFKSFWKCISKLFDSYGQIWEGFDQNKAINANVRCNKIENVFV